MAHDGPGDRAMALSRERFLAGEPVGPGRRAAMTDEGGHGLFLARLAQRWGTRHPPCGKVIWAEQPIPGS
ncbi:hypothetical protein ABZX30_25245 [Streptomyces sp. NPDC004542]|uniref:hypothetical protein n=1 Tax=Streptomyces sp. NPDC004542 TaxID=3154281 RepID=UPI0033AD3A67